ncbi:hypothetical protein NDU88_001244 [Pleurodeles waltl]|uniref:Uncharacterized protein n=1 Tax=Pleurodeles waltl TaxID=8319 RepID=A0AAV7P3C0_PLEWA|nr:hypothetical protein NDU88_001244 [Pleurodeles waltl]
MHAQVENHKRQRSKGQSAWTVNMGWSGKFEYSVETDTRELNAPCDVWLRESTCPAREQSPSRKQSGPCTQLEGGGRSQSLKLLQVKWRSPGQEAVSGIAAGARSRKRKIPNSEVALGHQEEEFLSGSRSKESRQELGARNRKVVQDAMRPRITVHV